MLFFIFVYLKNSVVLLYIFKILTERKMLMRKSIAKRLVSGFTSALVAVSYAIPSGLSSLGGRILKTNAANTVSNITGTNTTDDVTLLVGKTPVKHDGTPFTATEKASLESITQAYDEEYALGIASQFALFVSGDFAPKDSDAEGRTVIGGNLDVETSWASYVIGKGDYARGTALSTLLNNSDYASVILGGSVTVGKISNETNKPENDNSKLIVFNRNEDEVKQNIELYMKGFFENSTYTDVGKAQTYAVKLFDIEEQFENLNKRSHMMNHQK